MDPNEITWVWTPIPIHHRDLLISIVGWRYAPTNFPWLMFVDCYPILGWLQELQWPCTSLVFNVMPQSVLGKIFNDRLLVGRFPIHHVWLLSPWSSLCIPLLWFNISKAPAFSFAFSTPWNNIVVAWGLSYQMNFIFVSTSHIIFTYFHICSFFHHSPPTSARSLPCPCAAACCVAPFSAPPLPLQSRSRRRQNSAASRRASAFWGDSMGIVLGKWDIYGNFLEWDIMDIWYYLGNFLGYWEFTSKIDIPTLPNNIQHWD